EHDVERRRDDRRQEVGLDEPDAIRDRVAHRVLAGQVERIRRIVGAQDLDLAEGAATPQRYSEADRNRGAAGADVRDPDGWRAPRPRRRGEPLEDLRFGELDEALGLRARDERAGVSREREAVKLLEAADVGDGLTGRPPDERLLVTRRRAVAHDRLGMGDYDRSVGADRVGEEQLGVEPRALR